jgi:hypothetical protein
MRSDFKLILGSLFFLSLTSPVTAHTVETDANVGATFHIEPDHNPRAGETARAWFALTRQGGELIPLEQCNCQLRVKSQSSELKDASLPKPQLKAVAAEQYQNIPGADIVFPKAGIYQLEISGSPKGNAQFKAFKLAYEVTVLPGETAAPESQPETSNVPSSSQTPVTSSQWQEIAVAIALVALVSAGVWVYRKQLKSKQK